MKLSFLPIFTALFLIISCGKNDKQESQSESSDSLQVKITQSQIEESLRPISPLWNLPINQNRSGALSYCDMAENQLQGISHNQLILNAYPVARENTLNRNWDNIEQLISMTQVFRSLNQIKEEFDFSHDSLISFTRNLRTISRLKLRLTAQNIDRIKLTKSLFDRYAQAHLSHLSADKIIELEGKFSCFVEFIKPETTAQLGELKTTIDQGIFLLNFEVDNLSRLQQTLANKLNQSYTLNFTSNFQTARFHLNQTISAHNPSSTQEQNDSYIEFLQSLDALQLEHERFSKLSRAYEQLINFENLQQSQVHLEVPEGAILTLQSFMNEVGTSLELQNLTRRLLALQRAFRSLNSEL